MELNQFVEKFEEQFEETDTNIFNPSTLFKNLDEWSSLMELYITIMIEEIYKVEVNNQEFRQCSTIEDVYNLIQSRL